MPKYSMISAPDFMPVNRLREIQNQKFINVFQRTYQNVPWYRELLAKNNVDPNSIRSLADISKLPFIKKTDLRDTYPNGMLATSMDKIVRYHASSGTTGKPIVVPYTREDLDVWAECVSRCLTAFGLDESDVLQVGYGYGLFTGGLGLHDGGQRRGCTIVPVSGGNTERHLMFFRDLKVTAIACTPSYFLHIIDVAQKIGFDWKETKLKFGIFGAEPWTEEMRQFTSIRRSSIPTRFNPFRTANPANSSLRPSIRSECRSFVTARAISRRSLRNRARAVAPFDVSGEFRTAPTT